MIIAYSFGMTVGCLLDTYGHRVMYDAGSSIGPKLSTIISRGDWFWPHTKSNAIVEIQSRLHEVEIGEADQQVWDSKSGKFSNVDTWEKLRDKKSEVKWYDIVWFLTAIPKYAFFLWLAFRDIIVTWEHMCRWGYSGDSLCLFCCSCQEDRAHLFFEYNLNMRVWRALMAGCGIIDPPLTWNLVALWSLQYMKGRSVKATAIKLCFAAVTYNLWLHRNALLHGRPPKFEESLLSNIRWEVKVRLLTKFPSK
jgi:hypothetical protein